MHFLFNVAVSGLPSLTRAYDRAPQCRPEVGRCRSCSFPHPARSGRDISRASPTHTRTPHQAPFSSPALPLPHLPHNPIHPGQGFPLTRKPPSLARTKATLSTHASQRHHHHTPTTLLKRPDSETRARARPVRPDTPAPHALGASDRSRPADSCAAGVWGRGRRHGGGDGAGDSAAGEVYQGLCVGGADTQPPPPPGARRLTRTCSVVVGSPPPHMHQDAPQFLYEELETVGASAGPTAAFHAFLQPSQSPQPSPP